MTGGYGEQHSKIPFSRHYGITPLVKVQNAKGQLRGASWHYPQVGVARSHIEV
jgi:hypothetical protein